MAEWKRRFWKNTASSYVGLVIRLIVGLVMFRQMFENFREEEFGFWALLWSLFGYGVLLDFGFGFTAQKVVAEKSVSGDMAGLSKLLSTIFWTFVVMGVLIMTVMLLGRGAFLDGVDVGSNDRAEFAKAYLVFFVGMAVMFPLGLFPEVLRGLQRIDLANWVNLGATILNFGGIMWGLEAKWSFSTLMAVSVITSALPNAVAFWMAIRRLPGLSLSPKWFDWRVVKAQMSFSLVAYVIAFSNLLMSKSDQLVISMVLGVGAVAVYQAGFKMGEMLDLFSTQLQSALSPAAADLGARGDRVGLMELLTRSSRLTFLLVTPCYVLTAVYLDCLIRLLTGLETVPRETFWVGQVLAFAIFSSQLTNSCSKRILMMSGHERPLLIITVLDAALNLTLSLILAFQIGVLGVAIGTAVSTVLIGWILVIPFTLKRLGLSFGKFLAAHCKGTVAPLGIFAVAIILVHWLAPLPPDGGFVELAWRGALAGLPVALLSWPVLKEMTR